MKQTAVEWIIEQMNNVEPHRFCSLETIKEWCEQAKEIEKQQQDEFAIGFAEWTWNKELITINDCGYFEHKFNIYSRKELLEIYKKEKGL